MQFLKTIVAYRELIFNLVARDLNSRYRGSVLGLLWIVLTPLFMAFIYMFFLRLLMGRGVAIRHEEIIIGVFAWQFTVQSIQSGMSCITSNQNLVKKIFFPRIILPLSVTLAALVNYALMLAVQLVIVMVLLWLGGTHLSGWIILLPLVVGYHFVFNFSVGLLTAASNVYFRDTQHFVGVLLSAWFFLSPVMYPLSMLAGLTGDRAWVQEVYMLNPISIIITAYRALHVPATAFPWSWGVLVGLLWPVLFYVVAMKVYARAQKNFADYL